LRVGHFIGMHGLQALPLFAAGLAILGAGRLDDRVRLRLVLLAAGGVRRAHRADHGSGVTRRPLLGPSCPMAVAAAGLLALLIGGSLMIMRTAIPVGANR
jgi:hypothetical protein